MGGSLLPYDGIIMKCSVGASIRVPYRAESYLHHNYFSPYIFTPILRSDSVASYRKGTMPKATSNERIPEEPPSVEEDLYKILGVESTATPEAIKSAYKKSALRNHPGMLSLYRPSICGYSRNVTYTSKTRSAKMPVTQPTQNSNKSP